MLERLSARIAAHGTFNLRLSDGAALNARACTQLVGLERQHPFARTRRNATGAPTPSTRRPANAATAARYRGIIAAMPQASDNLAHLNPWPLRLLPGDDLRRALEAFVAANRQTAAFVLAGIGSLRPARLRLAGAETPLDLDRDLELLTLSGTIAAQGSHLHASVSDADGRVIGGHLAFGCIVRTTAEVLLASLPGWDFTRELDPRTLWQELVIQRRD